MVKFKKGYNSKLILMFLITAFFFINAVYACSLPQKINLRVPVGEDIDRLKKSLDARLGEYHKPNKYITYDPETGKFTLHLFTDFEETITPPYKKVKVTLDNIVASSIEPESARRAFNERFAAVRKRVVEETSKEKVQLSSIIAAFREYYGVFANFLTEAHCKELVESYELNENFLPTIERIKRTTWG